MKLPDFLAHLFHNYVFEAIDGQKSYKFVIKTVLTYGDWEQIEWLFDCCGAERVKRCRIYAYKTPLRENLVTGYLGYFTPGAWLPLFKAACYAGGFK